MASQSRQPADLGRSTIKMKTATALVLLLALGCTSNDTRVTQEMTSKIIARVLEDSAYWEMRKPYDQYLDDSVHEEEVDSELDVMQKRFRDAMSELGNENDDWEFPGHSQHVRVFYVYLYSKKLYSPKLASIIQDTMRGYDDRWIGEFECYEVPGCDDGRITQPLYLNGAFVFTKDDAIDELLPALGLQREDVEQ